MRFNIFASGLALTLGLAGVGTMSFARSETIGFTDVTVAQTPVDARKVEADRLFKQGNQQFDTNNFEAAFQSWQQSLRLYREIRDRLGEGNVLSNLGVAYKFLRNYPKAIEFQEQCLVIARELKDRRGEASILGHLGNAYYSFSNYTKAIEFQEQHLAIAREIKDRLGEGNALGNLGATYGSLRNYPKEIEFYEQSLVIAREIPNRRLEGQVLGNLGAAYQSLGNYPKAIEFYEQHMVIAREIPDRYGEGVALGNLGTAYSSFGKYSKSVEFYEQSLMIARELGDSLREVEVLGNLGSVYQSLDNYPKAVEFQEQSLAISRKLKDRRGEGNALNNLGIAYKALSNYPKAIEFQEQSLAIARELKDRLGEGNALSNLGIAHKALGNYPKAIEFQEQSLVISRELKDRRGEGQSLNNLGNVYFSFSNYPKAIEFQGQSLAIARELKDRLWEGRSLGNLGNTYRSLGNYPKAIEFQEQSLAISRERKDRLGEGVSFGGLGIAYLALGNYPKAIEFCEQSLAIMREIKSRNGEGTSLGHLGIAYQALGNYPKAIEFYEQSLTIAREIKDRRGEGRSLGNLGIAYLPLGNYPKAIEFQEQYLMIAREIEDRDAEQIALDNFGATLAKQEPELAIVFYKQAINVGENIRKDLKTLPRETQEIYTSSVATTYRQLANLLLNQGRTHEAQSILELLKVQELQNFENGQENKSAPIQFPIHPLESQALTTIEKSITSKQPLTLENLKTIGQPLTQNRDRITQDMNNSEITIGNPKAILSANPNAILIQNLVVNDKLWVLWTNSNGNTKAIVIPNVSQKQLEATVTEFREQIGNPNSDLNALKATSTKLYNWLIPSQLQTELAQNKQLIFSLDHVTRYIPVAALYDGKQYLAQRHSLSNIITTDSNMSDRLKSADRSPTILALGTTKAYPGFKALPGVEAELNAIVQTSNSNGIYPGKIQLNEIFTAQSLQTNDLEKYRILHIATHGSFNPKSITASFLLLGNGDRLNITDIANLNNLNDTHLVVLSACETGLSGGGQDGTEISGISGYFLRRGAKSVLASLWSVNDSSTALMMQQFYKILSQTNLTKAETLQKVQQDFISGKLNATEAAAIPRATARNKTEGRSIGDSFAHPYFWAPFVLTGNNL